MELPGSLYVSASGRITGFDVPIFWTCDRILLLGLITAGIGHPPKVSTLSAGIYSRPIASRILYKSQAQV
jgi:hypothetical protein